MEYKLTINFNGDGDGYESPNSNPEPKQPKTKPKDEEPSWNALTGGRIEQLDAFKSEMSMFSKVVPAVAVAKQMFQWQTSLVGRYTGSSLAQQKTNAAMNMLGEVAGVGAAFATGGVVGAAAAAGAIAFSYITDAEQRLYEKRWENIGLVYARERAGASMNRSRL